MIIIDGEQVASLQTIAYRKIIDQNIEIANIPYASNDYLERVKVINTSHINITAEFDGSINEYDEPDIDVHEHKFLINCVKELDTLWIVHYDVNKFYRNNMCKMSDKYDTILRFNLSNSVGMFPIIYPNNEDNIFVSPMQYKVNNTVIFIILLVERHKICINEEVYDGIVDIVALISKKHFNPNSDRDREIICSLNRTQSEKDFHEFYELFISLENFSHRYYNKNPMYGENQEAIDYYNKCKGNKDGKNSSPILLECIDRALRQFKKSHTRIEIRTIYYYLRKDAGSNLCQKDTTYLHDLWNKTNKNPNSLFITDKIVARHINILCRDRNICCGARHCSNKYSKKCTKYMCGACCTGCNYH